LRLPKVDNAIRVCQKYLLQTSTALKRTKFRTDYTEEIKSYLSQYLIVVICSEFEQKIENIVEHRIAGVNDPIAQDFIREGVSRSFRNPEIKKIKDLLCKFDGGKTQRKQKHERYWLKTKFETKLKHLDTADKDYDSIIAERHKIAHSEGTSMTLQDVIDYYKSAHKVLTAFKALLLSKL